MDAAKFDLETAWARLAEMLGWIVALFGAPAAIAACGYFRRKPRQDFLAWLAPLEALARRLLFIEAARLPPVNAPGAVGLRGRIASAFRDGAPDELPEESARWRVVFNVGAPASGRRSAHAAAAMAAHEIRANAVPLARRLEALLRLAQDRARAVQRLARRLRAAGRGGAGRFARYPRRTAFRETLDEAQREVDRVAAALPDTS